METRWMEIRLCKSRERRAVTLCTIQVWPHSLCTNASVRQIKMKSERTMAPNILPTFRRVNYLYVKIANRPCSAKAVLYGHLKKYCEKGSIWTFEKVDHFNLSFSWTH